MRRVAFVGLDGFEPTLADAMMDGGELPVLAGLLRRGASARLSDPVEFRTGLVWEHFLTGRGCHANGRFSAVRFDPARYQPQKWGALLRPPFYATDPPLRVLSFDVPYTNLGIEVPGIQITGWGSHDPAYPRASRPAGWLRRIDARFGPHPACNNDYACTWYRPEAMARQTAAVQAGARRRADVLLHLMRELPDWDLMLTVLSEAHSVGEQLWHGVDPSHPLGRTAAATRARAQLCGTYRAIDETVGRIADALPQDSVLVVASLHGMERNVADVLSMALLPELLHRHQIGEPFLRDPPDRDAWRRRGCPPLLPDADPANKWLDEMERFRPEGRPPPWQPEPPSRWQRARRELRERIAGPPPGPRAGPLGELIEPETTRTPAEIGEPCHEIRSQPPIWYRGRWPEMRAFAIPSFYDGRVRLNLAGRERDGVVAREAYAEVCDEIAALLEGCRDVRSGRPVVAGIERPRAADPWQPDGPDADLVVCWGVASDAIEHPALGTIGPYPFRRSGGHSPRGLAVVTGPGIGASELGPRSARDVVPTLLRLLGREPGPGIEGTSFPAAALGIPA